MRNPDRNPLDSACPTLFDLYPPCSELGIALRKGDARLRLREMDDAESGVRERERETAAIENRLQRMTAQHELDVQYLIEFGVSAAERAVFHQILGEVAQNGGLSLREAANLAHARRRSADSEKAGRKGGTGISGTDRQPASASRWTDPGECDRSQSAAK